jgi:rare lipoprotein A (peptidoglycan hydrolase)
MKAVLVSLLLALGAMFASTAPSMAADSQDDWWSKTFRNAAEADAPTVRRSASKPARSAQPKTAAKVISEKPKQVARASADDGSRPQRRQATKPVQARAPVTSSGTLTGVASYYWQPQPVASGGRFNPDALTAAHKTLPFGTRVRVTRADTGRSVEVVINDRGPYIAGRIIDLSRRAAQVIGMTDVGITRVNVAILGR